jgi:predicted dehydrogenase
MEKPISVHKADAERLLRAHRAPTQVFAAMFNQRTNPAYRKIRGMIGRGELGEIHRIQWTITDWFRSQAYYDSGGWRATWGGEGGGVLLNQCPHQLDLWQWLFGMPATVRAFVHLGRHHQIEVEDEVTSYLEYANGATGVFTTTTGEAPGTNRLEVAGDRGLLVYDANDRHMTFTRNAKTVTRAIAENRSFEKPETEIVKIRVGDGGRQHAEILENFAAAVRGREELIAPAAEGLHSVELANAMLLSGWLDRPVALPMSARRYAAQLKKRVDGSRFNKVVRETIEDDMSSSF